MPLFVYTTKFKYNIKKKNIEIYIKQYGVPKVLNNTIVSILNFNPFF